MLTDFTALGAELARVSNQRREALHIRMCARHGQGGPDWRAVLRIGRAISTRQVAEVVLRVDDEKLYVCAHEGASFQHEVISVN